MGDVKLNDPLHLPVQVSPDADEAIRRDWAEANISGGGGGTSFTAGVNALGLYIDSTAGGGATAGQNALGLYVASP